MKSNNLLNDRLKANLASYIEANSDTDTSSYRTKRELQIARLALEEGASAYLQFIDTLKLFISQLIDTIPSSTNLTADQLQQAQAKLFSTLDHLSQLLDKSDKLAALAHKVTAQAKTAAEIENLLSTKLDAAQIYSILTQLPPLLHSLLPTLLLNYLLSNNYQLINGHPLSRIELEEVFRTVAGLASNALDEEIQRNVNVLVYKPSPSDPNATNMRGGNAIVEDQVVQMLKSVPIDSLTVLPVDSPIANAIS